jgi:uncharacterized damage-inducible protein DinB
MKKPEPGTYPAYYQTYIDKVQGDDTIALMEKGLEETTGLIQSIAPDKEDHRYAEGKWSVKEVIGHIVDTERVFSYRAMCIARGEQGSLPGFEQDDYVAKGKFDKRSLSNLLEEYTGLRRSNIALFKSFDEEQASRMGTANKNPIQVRAIIAIIVGHEQHHMQVLKERYFSGAEVAHA